MNEGLRSIYTGRRVLLTGHTGFKGSWLALWLYRLGARVTGLARAPDTNPSLFEDARVEALLDHHVGDIRRANTVRRVWSIADPEIVFHLAAQPLVRASYDDPLETMETNVLGTAHVLDAARQCQEPVAVVAITSDKCYENKETGHAFGESDRLGGGDPYSASKACAELVAASWRTSFAMDGQSPERPAIATARAGNVIGGGDWQRDRLIPDCARAAHAGTPVVLRHPTAVRPWQHVLECLWGYLLLGARLLGSERATFASAFNFGPGGDDTWPVARVAARVCAALEMPAPVEEPSGAGPRESGVLRLNSTRAKQALGWAPRWPLAQALDRTAAWYARYENGSDARTLCEQDLDAFEAAES